MIPAVSLSPAAAANSLLKRIYALQPSIGAWAAAGLPNILWNSPQMARQGITQYIGPWASQLVMNSLHIEGEDREFMRSQAALDAILMVIDAMWAGTQLPGGLLPEETAHAPT